MTVKEFFASEISDLRGEVHSKHPMYNIQFINDLGEEDETQFTCESEASAEEELSAFFKEFCEENGFKTDSVIGISIVNDDDDDE